MIKQDAAFSDFLQASTVDRATGILINVVQADGVKEVSGGHLLESSRPVIAGQWRMMAVQTPGLYVSVWQWIYGTDIFLNGWPVLKIFAGLVLLGVWVIATL